MKATITAIRPERRFTTGDGSEMADLSVAFADGSVGHVYGAPGKVTAHVEALTKLIGVESEFELEEGKPYQGQANWKVKGYEGDPRKQGKGGGKGWGGKTPEERSEIAAQNALTAAAHVAAALIAAGSVRVNAEMAGAYVVQLQAQFFGSTRTLAGSMSSGVAALAAAPEPSLGEPPSATGSPESSEGGPAGAQIHGRASAEAVTAGTRIADSGASASKGQPPSEPPTPLGEYAGSASPVDNGPDFGDSLFGSDGPASPTQLERLEHVYGGRQKALKAAFFLHNQPVSWEAITAGDAGTLIEKKVNA